MGAVLLTKVKEFYSSLQKVDNHRYKSWEHCRVYFKKLKDKKTRKLAKGDKQIAGLHLGFYMASWGGRTQLWNQHKLSITQDI